MGWALQPAAIAFVVLAAVSAMMGDHPHVARALPWLFFTAFALLAGAAFALGLPGARARVTSSPETGGRP
jgi:hypothetical protein